MKFKKVLTARQSALYEYLKEQTEFKKIKDIIEETQLYGEYSESVNCAGVRALKRDLRVLRAKDRVEKTPISNTKKGIKIPTKDEYIENSKRRWKALARAIELQKLQDKKAGLDGQYRAVFNQEKDIIEAFVG